jgi:hypothetical protein
MDAVTAANYKAGVTAAGVADGINLVFTLPNTPVASTEMIFCEWVLQQREQVTITKLLGLQLLSRLETHRSLLQM